MWGTRPENFTSNVPQENKNFTENLSKFLIDQLLMRLTPVVTTALFLWKRGSKAWIFNQELKLISKRRKKKVKNCENLKRIG